MSAKKLVIPNHTLAEVKEQFKAWRKTRKGPHPIPGELWEAAVSLSTRHSISQISRELILDYNSLKERVRPKKKYATTKKVNPPAFIELGFEQPSAVSEYNLEMENNCGSKVKLHCRGKTDFNLLELVNVFWSKKT